LRHRFADQAAAADEPDGLAPNIGAHQICRLAAGEFAGAHRAVAFQDSPRHREHQAEIEIGGCFRGDRGRHRDGNALLRRRRYVDIRRRDRLRRDQAQLRIRGDDGAIDLVVEEAE
jgi:hypothetical protein